MRYFLFIPLLFLAACASQPRLAVRPAPPPFVEPVDSVRYAEVVRAYYVGRSVDPNHPETMDEQHAVYRVEVSAHWNLHPGPQTIANLLNPPADAAFVVPPTNDVLIAEMNRQREATARVMQEADRLAQSDAALQRVIGEMKNTARNGTLLNAGPTNPDQPAAEFATELEKFTGPPVPHTNGAPESISEPLATPEP